MSQVITLESYTPIARFDGIPWTLARIEEATLSAGPWSAIDVITLSPVDADPSAPATRDLTTALASSTMGLWYRIVFVDASANESAPTSPVRNTQPPAAPVNSPMTFLDLQDAVMDGAFGESKRDLVKGWINSKYGVLVDEEEWTFTQASTAVSVTSSSRDVGNVPGDLAAVLSIQRADGGWLEPIEEYRDFAQRYLGGNAPGGIPEAFYTDGTTISVGPTSTQTSDGYLLVYERVATLMVDDEDTPIIPAQYHLGLVFDARAAGYALTDEALANQYAAQAQAIFAPMRRRYLRASRGTATQAAAYRPC